MLRCIVLQCLAVCCSVLQCVAVCCSVLQLHFMQKSEGETLRNVHIVHYSVAQCVAALCVLQCVAVCCTVLPCVAATDYAHVERFGEALKCVYALWCLSTCT